MRIHDFDDASICAPAAVIRSRLIFLGVLPGLGSTITATTGPCGPAVTFKPWATAICLAASGRRSFSCAILLNNPLSFLCGPGGPAHVVDVAEAKQKQSVQTSRARVKIVVSFLKKARF